MTKHGARLAGVVLAVASATACLTSSRMPTETPAGKTISPKLTPFSYYEEGPLLFVAVETRAAQEIDEEENTLFPIAIGLANRGQRPLSFNREGFTLETSSRQLFKLVDVKEYNRDYDRLPIDQRLTEPFTEALNGRFETYTHEAQYLFPPRGSSAIVTDSFDIAPSEWTHMFLYFPIPDTGLHGETFRLLIEIEEMPETFVVGFEVK